jgi:ABC-type proline/glycine betaine transport system substrate-binding protein
MKTLELEQLENVHGGNIVDGACAVLGITASGVAVRAAMARLGMTVFFAIPGWGQAVLAAGIVGCTIYRLSQ